MTTALYRRYRPENFGEMIGQSQVTEPLMTALRGDRVGHAYLFSGPRGCGKTTSARILARCLNCAEGPTDVPCGVCPSCVELSRSGGGSLDVVEIAAASHNGVDDARDLRERATFAPSRDRFKIFILDEAHMVTPQGFNALLKLVEEPPAHVKFIFATTEPEKVLGTIRSRTHHYPFRLVPPAAMLEYVEKLCGEEGVQVEQGVLPLAVRAGGGSPRDTLSLLDQLIAGSDGGNVTYERAVALLGYTHAALLDEIVDALAAGDAAAAFPAVDRVVQTGQDPRRFVDDLLERLRDLIVIAAVGDGATAVLRGIPDDELQRMRAQASSFGSARLSRTADLVSQALDDMSGATSPRLHLELMVARVLAGASAGQGGEAPATRSAVPAPAAPAASSPAPASARPAASAPAAAPAPAVGVPAGDVPVASDDSPVADAAATAPERPAPEPPVAEAAVVEAASASAASPAVAPVEGNESAPVAAAEQSAPSGPVTLERIVASWSAVLDRLAGLSRSSWLVVTGVQPLAYDDSVLTLGFAVQTDVAKFKGTTPGAGPSDHLRSAIEQELGVKVKYRPAPLPPGGGSGGGGGAPRAPRSGPSGGGRAEDDAPASGWATPGVTSPGGDQPAPSSGSASASDPASAPGGASAPRAAAVRPSAAPVTEWAVAPIPTSDDEVVQPQFAVDEEPAEVESAASAPVPPVDGMVDRDEPPLPGDDEAPDEDEPPYDPPYDAPSAPPARPAAQEPAAPASASRVEERTPVVTARSAAPDGVQRYGEAVVRQVLGATFVREEPYEPTTRFS